MSTTTVNRLAQCRSVQQPFGYSATSLAKVSIALDSAYTYGSAGDAFMFGFAPDTSGNLTDLWIAVELFTGTWGSTDGVINVSVREDINGAGIPGTTEVSNFTITLAGSESGWVKKSGLSIALTAGRFYTIVIADADGGASNYVTLTQSCAVGVPGSTGIANASYTTNGFASAGTASTSAAVCLKVDGIMYGGAIYSAIATDTSGTFKRGNKFTTIDPVTIVGVFDPDLYYILNLGGTVSLFSSTQAPGDTPLKTWTIPTSTYTGSAPFVTSLMFPAADWYDLSPATTYIFVIAPTSAMTVPRKITQLAGADADINALKPYGAYYLKDNSGSWAESTDVLSVFVPLLAPSASSGGGGLIVHPGWGGGFVR